MGKYIDIKTKAMVEIDESAFQFPTSGAKILLKMRPPLAKEAPTD